MKQKHLLKIAMLFVFAVISNISYGQLVTTIDFENDSDGYTPSTFTGSSSSYRIIFNRTNSNLPNVTNVDGYYWAAEDIPNSSPNPYIDLNQIDVSGATSFTFSIDMTARHFDDWDDSDELLITYSIDGGTYQNLMWVQNTEDGDQYNTPAALDTDFDGEGDCSTENTLPALVAGTGSSGCAVSSSNFKTFTTNSISLSSNSTLDIKLQFNGLTSQAEGIYLDNIMITQSQPSGITWTGSSNSDWATAGNWDNGVPSSSDNVTVPDVANAPIIGATTGAITNDLTITEPDGINITAGGSLIVSGTSSGNITYTRNLATTNWYLVSSPVIGQDIDTFVSAAGLASGTNNNNMGLASYVNTSSVWSYYQSGASGTGDFTSASGRSIKLAAAGDISFTGTMPVDNVNLAITNGYNLVGNPYPSYIAANTAADSSDNILTVNTSILSEATLWMWNQATSDYDAINQASNSMDIAPAQGFFVETSGSNTLSITEAMQSHQSSDSFQRLSNERPEISLVLSDGENIRDTDIYYIDGTTTGFDNGYDSTTFSGAANSFSIYTHLVANSNGQDLAIQSLPNSDLDTMIIPVGITAAAGEEISISANAINLPEGVNIYLEDKNDDSFTLLDSTSVFTTTPDEDLNGIGRFYIHTTATALSDNQVSLTNVSMYVVDSSLTITGVHTANASIRVYDLVGKEVVNTSFEGTGLNKIELPILTTGVYVVQLETQTEAVNKKIIIKK